MPPEIVGSIPTRRFMRSFFFHYNKPESQRRGKVTVSVHYKGACHLVDSVVCNVPTQGKSRSRQPRFVMTGKASDLQIKDGVAVLN